MPKDEMLQRESRIGENPPYGLVCGEKAMRRSRRAFISVWVVCQMQKALNVVHFFFSLVSVPNPLKKEWGFHSPPSEAYRFAAIGLRRYFSWWPPFPLCRWPQAINFGVWGGAPRSIRFSTFLAGNLSSFPAAHAFSPKAINSGDDLVPVVFTGAGGGR